MSRLRRAQSRRVLTILAAVAALSYLTFSSAGTVDLGPSNGGRGSLHCHDLYMPGVSEPYAYTCERVR